MIPVEYSASALPKQSNGYANSLGDVLCNAQHLLSG